MTMQIIGEVDPNRLFCSGSFTKLLTTFVCLSLLSEKYNLSDILDDDLFLDQISQTKTAKAFLQLAKRLIGNNFSIHDLCSYYAGLPYTFDVSELELARVEAGHPFKHHSILDENFFLEMCINHVTPIYTNRCKFHYSELSIIFLGYLIEKIYDLRIESLFDIYLIKKFNLKKSIFSRKRVPNLYIQDLSWKYDYPSVAILDHGYFCYSNGFFTTLNDMKILLENLLKEPIFHFMTDLSHARAASNTLMNGLTVEIRQMNDDIIYGYEGLSFSGCNIWAYSTKHQQGFLTFTNDEEAAYPIIYDNWNYSTFDKAPEYTQNIYKHFVLHKQTVMAIDIPKEYQGSYRRVNVNKSSLNIHFTVGSNYIVIRDPEEIKYNVMCINDQYWIKGKDGLHGAKIGLVKSQHGNFYMYHDGTLYKKITSDLAIQEKDNG